MLLVILNLLALYIINYPTQFFKVSRFNIYGLNKLRFNAAKLFIKIVKPFITNDFTNKLLILVFINSSCLAFYLVNLPDSSYTGLYKNLIYSFLSASIFSIFEANLSKKFKASSLGSSSSPNGKILVQAIEVLKHLNPISLNKAISSL